VLPRRPPFARLFNPATARLVSELVAELGEDNAAALLGVPVFMLTFKSHILPVQRSVYLLHRMVFNPSPVTAFDILTSGRWTPQEPVAVTARTCEKANDFSPPFQVE